MATITDLHITGLSSKKERLAGKEYITYTTKIRHAHKEDYSGGLRGGAREAIHCLYDTSCSEYKGMDAWCETQSNSKDLIKCHLALTNKLSYIYIIKVASTTSLFR